MVKKISAIKLFLRFCIKNTIWLSRHYAKLRQELKALDITDVHLFKFVKWNSGFNYFIGHKKGEKVFIKFCCSEYNTIHAESEIATYKFPFAPRVIGYSTEGYNYIVTEFLEFKPVVVYAETTDISAIITQACIILDELYKNGIMHRDIRPENLGIDSNGKLLLFDYGWAIYKKYAFRRTDYKFIEHILNLSYRPANEEFDDAYSMYKSLKEELNISNEELNDVIKRIGRFVLPKEV